jgi:uncharacterized surface protein with fasciclin (FAS1) repeats
MTNMMGLKPNNINFFNHKRRKKRRKKMKKTKWIIIPIFMATLLAFVFSPAVFAQGRPADKPPADRGQGQPGPTIVEVAIAVNDATGEFSTLIAAILAADPAVLTALNGNGQYTVFAPTDAAFAALGLDASNIGTVPQDVLTKILLYHVRRGRLYATDVLEKDRLRMLYPAFLFQDGGVLTDTQGGTANIIITDVEAGNGIIHVIDAVVLPFAL